MMPRFSQSRLCCTTWAYQQALMVRCDLRWKARTLRANSRASRVTRAVCCIVETRPGTTYDNFARDFGERFIAGYKVPSTVDYLLNSPFSE